MRARLSYFLRTSAPRSENKKSGETSYVEVLAEVAAIVAGSGNFRRLIEIKESFFLLSLTKYCSPGSGSLRLRGCNKRPDFHRNDQQLTNQVALRPHSTISATLFFGTLWYFIRYNTKEIEGISLQITVTYLKIAKRVPYYLISFFYSILYLLFLPFLIEINSIEIQFIIAQNLKSNY